MEMSGSLNVSGDLNISKDGHRAVLTIFRLTNCYNTLLESLKVSVASRKNLEPKKKTKQNKRRG